MQQISRAEYEKTKKYLTKNVCPFCTKLEKERIIYKTKYWYVMPNKHPYFDDKNQLMVFPKRHIEFTSQLNEEELKDFVNIEKWMKEFYKDKGDYFSFIRQTKSNKSVEHMHYHYVVGIPSPRILDGENYFKVKDGYFSK